MTWIGDNLGLIWEQLREHLYLAILPVILGLLISVPLGYVATRFSWLANPLIAFGGVLYSLPSIALFIVLPLIGLFMPFAVFWMRAHFVNMPSEISEAARVDGANTWDLFWRIHVPLARAPIASLGVLMSVWAWNQFLLALVLVEDPTQRTMAGALGAFGRAAGVVRADHGTLRDRLPRAAQRDRLHAAGGLGPGEVGDPAGRARRRRAGLGDRAGRFA